jgi:hypothetical protein
MLITKALSSVNVTNVSEQHTPRMGRIKGSPKTAKASIVRHLLLIGREKYIPNDITRYPNTAKCTTRYVTCHPAIVANVTVGTFSGSAFTTAVGSGK